MRRRLNSLSQHRLEGVLPRGYFQSDGQCPQLTLGEAVQANLDKIFLRRDDGRVLWHLAGPVPQIVHIRARVRVMIRKRSPRRDTQTEAFERPSKRIRIPQAAKG